MIVTRLHGGLGNQMFQYATGKAMAHRANTELRLDKSHLQTHDKRDFKLYAFDIEENVIYPPDIEARDLTKYSEYMIDFEEELLEPQDDVYLDGYWQSEQYFSDIEGKIREDFTLTQPLGKQNRGLLSMILDNKSVALHVRRGDYVKEESGEYIYFIGLDYYKKALETLEKKIGDFELFVFSDDIEWARENISWPANFWDENDGETDYIDMFLMSQCDHNIIANSTFSWWSAWLNDNPNKQVIAPRRWFKTDEAMNKDVRIIPGEWLGI